MSEPVNLWSALTALEYHTRRTPHGPSPEVQKDFITELGRSSRFYNQEFSVKPTGEGWLIEFFGCDIDSLYDKVIVLIPKDRMQPVKIIKDRAGRIEHHHD